MSRVLAGPWATQLLVNYGAGVIKVERLGSGDDTRSWGPPYVANGDAAYFHSANRNKKSVAINIASPGGADLVTRMPKLCARREQSDNPRPNLHAFMNRPNASLWLQQDLTAHPPELGQVQRGVRL